MKLFKNQFYIFTGETLVLWLTQYVKLSILSSLNQVENFCQWGEIIQLSERYLDYFDNLGNEMRRISPLVPKYCNLIWEEIKKHLNLDWKQIK